MRASTCLLFGCTAALFLCSGAWAQTGLGDDAFNNYGGLYAVDCSKPQSPRVTVERTTLTLQNGGRRWVVRDLDAIYAWYGQQEPPPGFQVALTSSSGSQANIAFMVKTDTLGQYIEIDEDPTVKAAIGVVLIRAKFRSCDLVRNRQMARDLKAEARARAAASAPMPTSQAMHPSDLVRDKRFKVAWVKALGPLSRERWPAGLEGPAPEIKHEQLGGQSWLVAASCKPHDCGDNNAVLIYDEASGRLYGLVYHARTHRLVGAPPSPLKEELQRIWRREWGPR